MNIEPQLSFKNMEHSMTVEAVVAKNLRKLEKHHKNLASCRVVFERPQRRHTHGDHYRVSLDLKLAGGIELAVTRDPPLDKDRDSAIRVRSIQGVATAMLSPKELLNDAQRPRLSTVAIQHLLYLRSGYLDLHACTLFLQHQERA